MTNADKMMLFLRDHPGNVCDDCISNRTGVTPRQQINQLGNKLAVANLLLRSDNKCMFCGKFKTTSSRADWKNELQSIHTAQESAIELTRDVTTIEPEQSNKARGSSFSKRVGEYLSKAGLNLTPEYPVALGLSVHHKKVHCFDLGDEKTLVECKYYGWTEGGNNPSAKISILNEAMMYFVCVPAGFRKLLFLPKTKTKGVRRVETFLEYYIRLYQFLIPDDVEVWEFDETTGAALRKYN